jgi:hypothetical protein
MNRQAVLRLYRDILKEHRKKLPSMMQELGDSYVRNEWKLHKQTTPASVKIFLREWENYLITLRAQKQVVGANIKQEKLSNLSEEQKRQLEKLKKEAIEAFQE